MQLMPQGDHYIWYCAWCDTRNTTLWIKIEKNQLCCSACHKKSSAFEETQLSRPSGEMAYYQLLP